MRVVGYVDRLSVSPGEDLGVMVSSEEPRFSASVVRLIHGDVDGPGFRSEPVPSALDGDWPGRVQPIRLGSCVRVPGLQLGASCTVTLHLHATLPGGGDQAIVSTRSAGAGWTLGIRDGVPSVWDAADETVLALAEPLDEHAWYRLVLDLAPQEVALAAERVVALAVPGDAEARVAVDPGRLDPGAGDLLLGAEVDGAHTHRHLNGRIAAPRIDAGGAVVARWDLARDIPTSHVRDAGPGGHHGRTVNRPARAVTDHTWDGTETDWRHATGGYDAIHLHADDLDDAGWERTLTWPVPADLPSGVYAVHLQAGGEEDYVPFAVRPRRGRPTARVAFLMPTFSYLAYGNEQMLAGGAAEFFEQVDGIKIDYPVLPQDRYIVEHGLRSMYDRHLDGSGVLYASRLRPILNMRPKYHMSPLDMGRGGAHQFNADLHLVDWLHARGTRFDVITDEDLHEEGAGLLSGYRVVLSGSHPEYWSLQMLTGAQDWIAGGGRFMYLGGNGMYWVTQRDPESGHTIEIRRLGPSTRNWEPGPGEGHLSTTGELGGLWRYRGHAPQRWLGTGYTAQGNDQGRPYARTAASRDPRVAFVFAGLGEDELIGDVPALVDRHGAAGFEFDRADHALGTPRDAFVLATATGFSDSYQHVIEETMLSDSRQSASVNPLVRADMVLVPHPGGGAVFSTGSITWCSCLSHDGYRNSVSTVTGNVLDRFAADGPVLD